MSPAVGHELGWRDVSELALAAPVVVQVDVFGNGSLDVSYGTAARLGDALTCPAAG